MEGIEISGGCSKVTGGSGLIIITSGRGSNSRYYMWTSGLEFSGSNLERIVS